jgi:Peptidase family M23/Tetratricopeptide repeat
VVPFTLLWLALAPGSCTVGERSTCPREQFCAATFAAGTAVCPTSGVCEALPAAADLLLSLPVPAGGRVYCIHGVLEAGTDTHSTCSEDRRFALDLASSAFEAPHLVLASADGLAYAWGDCPSTDLNHAPPDATCNVGLGNVVRIQHSGGLFTQYAHLSAILVSRGQAVKRGQPVGVEGNSGAAGPKHLHWSLHRGDGSRLEPAPSLPMRRVRLRGGQVMDTLAFRCDQYTREEVPSPATAYVSDNRVVRAPPRIGLLPAPRLALEYAVGKIFDPSTRAAGMAGLRASGEPLARYWLAVALELDGNSDAARSLFTALVKTPAGPEWVRRWSLLRLADIAARQNRPAEARQALERARRNAPIHDIDFLRFVEWVRREVEWLERGSAR